MADNDRSRRDVFEDEFRRPRPESEAREGDRHADPTDDGGETHAASGAETAEEYLGGVGKVAGRVVDKVVEDGSAAASKVADVVGNAAESLASGAQSAWNVVSGGRSDGEGEDNDGDGEGDGDTISGGELEELVDDALGDSAGGSAPALPDPMIGIDALESTGGDPFAMDDLGAEPGLDDPFTDDGV